MSNTIQPSQYDPADLRGLPPAPVTPEEVLLLSRALVCLVQRYPEMVEVCAAIAKDAVAQRNLVDDVVTPYRGLYLCSRTSLGVLSNAQPCEEAKRVLVRTRARAYMEEWAVEIPDLPAFVTKYGRCILGCDDSGFCTVEIYDDYRE